MAPEHQGKWWSDARQGARWVLGALVTAVGCASGSGGGGDAVGVSASRPAPDGTPAAETNARLFAAAAADEVGAATAPPSGEYEVGAGDRIGVEVFGAPTFSGVFAVDDAGRIAIPLLGSVPVAGHTPLAIEDTLEARLGATYMRDPHVTVRVDEMRSHGVSVLGAVRRPGVYQVSGRSTLLEVLAMAEGLTETAGSTVVVARRERGAPRSSGSAGSGDVAQAMLPTEAGQVVEIDLGEAMSGKPEANLEIRAGDIVQVRPAAMVYVVGEVTRPGGYTVPLGESMTVLQAIAMAGGLGGTAAASSSMIVRERGDGTREEIEVDLDEVLDGSESPPTLVANDVLFVPNNDTKSFALGAVSTLVRMVTFRGLIY